MRLRAPAVVKGGASLLFLAAQGTRGLLSGCTTTMQFARPRTVERRLLPASTAGSIPNGASAAGGASSREEAIAPVAQATKRGRGVAAKGSGLALGETGRRARAAGEETWGAAAVVPGGGSKEEDSGSAMQSLRHSVAGLPRLSREEELALFEDVQRWQRLERIREEVSLQGGSAMGGGGRRKVGLEEWASAAGIGVADLRELVDRGTEARERLVLSHVRLVMFLAGKRGGRTALSSMDLIQEGAIALHLAVERYDPARGVRFFTYADWSLRAAFEKAEATQATTIAMPRYVYAQKRRLKAILWHQRPQTQKELATSLDISERQVGKLLSWANDCQSSDRVLIAGGTALGESIPSAQTSEAILRRLDAEAAMIRLLGYLKPQEEQVIVHRYGLFGRGRKSTPAVAAVMGVTRQYVGRVHKTALNKMRASFEDAQQPRFHGKATTRSSAVTLKGSRRARRGATTRLPPDVRIAKLDALRAEG